MMAAACFRVALSGGAVLCSRRTATPAPKG
jgi:hypothetical protein